MSKQIALRDAYGNALAKLGAQNPKVVALESDVGSSSKSSVFGAQFPDRYFNVGISELDMNAMAAGFAAGGFIPFTNTFAVFMTLRGGDAINSLICYDNLNVKLAGTYCGLSDSFDGASHHATSDLALVCSLPNMTVISPCDAVETEKAVFAAAAHQGPVYLRLSRAPMPVLAESAPFEIGKGIVVHPGSDLTIVATGYMVHKALEAAKQLEGEGISARVVNMHTLKPLDEDLLQRCAEETGAVLTAEEHSLHGGLGSLVSAALAQKSPVPMEMIGLDRYAESGGYEQLLSKYELDAAAIVRKAAALNARKKGNR